MREIKVIGERILINKLQEEEKKEKKTESGLYLPGTSSDEKDNFAIATVRAVGRDIDYINSGDEILIDKRMVNDIELNGEEFQLIGLGDVIAVV